MVPEGRSGLEREPPAGSIDGDGAEEGLKVRQIAREVGERLGRDL
jgi:hypothetical protein